MENPANTSSHYDILVVGGGINGAGVAQCAAACGYKTLLLEQKQWGSGTSSKSSKLVHGGLRYLQSGQLKMVYESLRERKLLMKLAPQLVTQNSFFIPIYSQSRLKAWYICIGLFLYYLLSGFASTNQFRRLPKSQWCTLPFLKQQGLKAVLEYHDCQTDDRALTHAVADSAANLGAGCLENTKLISAKKQQQGYLATLEIQTESGTEIMEVHCKVLINAAGPWINSVADTMSPAPQKVEIDLVQGSHLVLTPQLSEQCFYLESPSDGRAVFVLPWQGKTLLGTTETGHHDEPEKSALTQTEQEYLLGILAHYFPDYRGELVSHMAGLRVLPHKPGAVHTRSREVVLLTDSAKPEYIAVYGGKLTTYRSTAEKVIHLAAQMLGKGEYPPERTRNIHL